MVLLGAQTYQARQKVFAVIMTCMSVSELQYGLPEHVSMALSSSSFLVVLLAGSLHAGQLRGRQGV